MARWEVLEILGSRVWVYYSTVLFLCCLSFPFEGWWSTVFGDWNHSVTSDVKLPVLILPAAFNHTSVTSVCVLSAQTCTVNEMWSKVAFHQMV